MGKFVLEKAKVHGMESIGQILAKARNLGMTLCIENMFPQVNFLHKPQEFQRVFETFPDLRLILDIGHANLGERKSKSSEFIHRFGYRISHVHAIDNFGKEDNHLPIGAGIIDFEKILRELKQAQYDETITLEVFSKDREYLKISKEKIERMWEGL